MRPASKLGLLQILAVSALCRLDGADVATLGSNSCSASGCHGGGGGGHNGQFVTWSERDAHSRSYATLTTAIAGRMGEALGIANPAASSRCVICHAPLEGAAPASLGTGVDPTEGVSCVSCHDLPTHWLRGHTRNDWTHADRVAAGMRDLDDLYTRANTCVACHQNIDPQIVSAGRHPSLIFELDGQTQDEPRHWRERTFDSGAQAWFVGQAVALREVSWALLNAKSDPSRSTAAWQGLSWLMDRSGLGFDTNAPSPPSPSAADLAVAVEKADQIAKHAAISWEPQYAGAILRRLAATQADFLANDASPTAQACRAERLVLALDRLLAALPASQRPPGSSARLDRLFSLAQSQPDFAPAEFARELDAFSRGLGG